VGNKENAEALNLIATVDVQEAFKTAY